MKKNLTNPTPTGSVLPSRQVLAGASLLEEQHGITILKGILKGIYKGSIIGIMGLGKYGSRYLNWD